MTPEDREILIRIDQRTQDFAEKTTDCLDRHSREIGTLYGRTEKNGSNIAKIVGASSAVVILITIAISLIALL